MYFLISTVSFKIVYLGPYTEIATHSQYSIRCIVRNSASVSHSFSCIMVISSNLLPLNAILGFGKIRKECSTKILQVGKVLNDSYLHSQKFKHQQSSQQMHCHSAETNPLNSTTQVSFAAHFPADAVRFQCINVDLHFVLVDQMYDTQLQ